MFINARPKAISMAVISFFGFSFAGLFGELTPLTCCKRAFIGAVIVYTLTSIAIKIVNQVLASAIIDSFINRKKEI